MSIFNLRYVKNDNSPERLWLSGRSKDSFFSYVMRGSETPVFNLDGFLTHEELKGEKILAQQAQAPIWSGFLSWHGEGVNTPERAQLLFKEVMGTWFNLVGLNRDKFRTFGVLHTDTDNLHIHFQFYETEPTRIVNGRKEYVPKFSKDELRLARTLLERHLSKMASTYLPKYQRSADAITMRMFKNRLSKFKEGDEVSDEEVQVLARNFIKAYPVVERNLNRVEDKQKAQQQIEMEVRGLVNTLIFPLMARTKVGKSRYSAKINARQKRRYREKRIQDTLRNLSDYFRLERESEMKKIYENIQNETTASR